MITGIQYFHLLGNLCTVAEEAGAVVNGKEELDYYQGNPSFTKAFESFPPSSIDQVAKKVQGFVASLLIIYEAANRAQLPNLAKKCLLQWQNELDQKMQLKFKTNSYSLILYDGHLATQVSEVTKADYEKMEGKLKKLVAKILCPKFQDSEKAERELTQGLKHILSKELIWMKFSEHPSDTIPEHAKHALGKLSPNEYEDFLIKKYGNIPKRITFSDFDKLTMNDRLLMVYLERFPQANYLDVSHCIKLTPVSFQKGHKAIEALVLTGTSIEASTIDRSLFPQLKTIKQEKICKVFNLNQVLQNEFLFSTQLKKHLWTQIKNQSKVADLVLIDKNKLKSLAEAFQKTPNSESLEALLALKKCLSRSENCNVLEYNKIFYTSCIPIWKNCPAEDWEKSESFGQTILTLLIESWVASSSIKNDVHSLICQAFFDDLTITHEEEKYDKNLGQRVPMSTKITSDDRARIRFLMREFRVIEWSQYPQIACCVASQIEDLNEKLFIKKNRDVFGFEERDRDVATKELLNEIYVELSYHIPELIGPFGELKDPHKVTKQSHPIRGNDSQLLLHILENVFLSETVLPGPFYHETTDQTLACAFVLNTSTSNREKLLRNILANFSEYSSQSPYYSLAKIVLGTVREKDIPTEDCDSLLKERLLRYKGIFCEEIDNGLKEQFWTALCEGKLGGITLGLIDGLVDFYFQGKADEYWKEKVKEALEFIGGVLFTGFISKHPYANIFTDDPIKQYARQRLQEFF